MRSIILEKQGSTKIKLVRLVRSFNLNIDVIRPDLMSPIVNHGFNRLVLLSVPLNFRKFFFILFVEIFCFKDNSYALIDILTSHD